MRTKDLQYELDNIKHRLDRLATKPETPGVTVGLDSGAQIFFEGAISWRVDGGVVTVYSDTSPTTRASFRDWTGVWRVP